MLDHDDGLVGLLLYELGVAVAGVCAGGAVVLVGSGVAEVSVPAHAPPASSMISAGGMNRRVRRIRGSGWVGRVGRLMIMAPR